MQRYHRRIEEVGEAGEYPLGLESGHSKNGTNGTSRGRGHLRGVQPEDLRAFLDRNPPALVGGDHHTLVHSNPPKMSDIVSMGKMDSGYTCSGLRR